MKSYAAVTTMNKSYYDLIGHAMIDSFIKYWPTSIKLYVFTEGFDLPVTAENIISKDVFEVCDPGLSSFLEWRGLHYTKKFAFKAYTWINACKILDEDILIYLDADTETKTPVPLNFIENILKDDSILAYMYAPATVQENGKTIIIDNAETCIYWFDNNHTFSKKFMQHYEDIYESRRISDRTVFRKPHDTWVITDCVRFAKENNTQVINLHTEKNSRSPIKKTILYEYFSHFKGKQKFVQGTL
jgi:hypothetical protein|tara:strand:- start:1180 stop:1911 length:732 start_codon:yes stop_codon:yes gene_type:complete